MQVSGCLFVSKLWHTGLKLTGMHTQEEGGRVLVCDLIQWFWFVTLLYSFLHLYFKEDGVPLATLQSFNLTVKVL